MFLHFTPLQDLRYFKSEKTSRGMLQEGWRDTQDPIMCSYKLVTVKFEVWGLQTRVEQFVHKVRGDPGEEVSSTCSSTFKTLKPNVFKEGSEFIRLLNPVLICTFLFKHWVNTLNNCLPLWVSDDFLLLYCRWFEIFYCWDTGRPLHGWMNGSVGLWALLQSCCLHNFHFFMNTNVHLFTCSLLIFP